MELKRCFVAANCLALLLAIVGRAEAAGTGASAASFDVVEDGVTQQRRIKRRATRRHVSRRAKQVEVAEGLWGGAHVRMTVREGRAALEFDCARGEITAPLKTNAEGRFDLAGTFTRESPGPIRLGLSPAAKPARYVGRVEGSTMTLSITIDGTDREPRPFTLMRGSEGRLWKCR